MSSTRSGALERIETESRKVYAFRIDGRVSASDLAYMAQTLAVAFDAHLDRIDLVIIVRRLDPAELLELADPIAIRRQLASIHRVDRLVLVNSSTDSAPLIGLLSTLTPVSTHHFGIPDIADVWELVGTRPSVSGDV